MLGTVRSYNPEVREYIFERIETICEGVAVSHGASIELEIGPESPGTPAVINRGQEQVDNVIAAASVIVDPEVIYEPEPSMTGGSRLFCFFFFYNCLFSLCIMCVVVFAGVSFLRSYGSYNLKEVIAFVVGDGRDDQNNNGIKKERERERGEQDCGPKATPTSPTSRAPRK